VSAAFGSASSDPFSGRSAAELKFSGAPHAGKGVFGSGIRHSRFKSASGLQGRLAMARI
jgi:hypothetical protein